MGDSIERVNAGARVRPLGFGARIRWTPTQCETDRPVHLRFRETGPRGGVIAAKLFVGNLSFKTTRDQLTELFEQCGELVDVFVPMDRATGKPRGFAFVEFANESDAKDAIEKFNGHELEGRALRVNEATERPQRPPRPPSFRGGGGGRFDDDGGGGGFYGGPPGRPSRPKGSRRNARGKKRSL